MAQKQNEKEALLCTHGNCKALQVEDGEFCDKHFPTFISGPIRADWVEGEDN